MDMLVLCGIDEVQTFRGRSRTPVPIRSLSVLTHGSA
jgi:hypothetical protein